MNEVPTTPQTSQETLPTPTVVGQESEGTPANVPPVAPETSPSPAPVTPPAPPAVPPAPPVDYREKFGASTRENQVLVGQLKELEQQLGEITREEIPTDEEMVRKYPEFEYASEIEKTLLKRTEVMDRRTKGVQLGLTRIVSAAERRQKLAEIANSDTRLQGKADRFVEFAMHPSRENVPADTLLSAFLFEVRDETPTIETPPVPAPSPAPEPPKAEASPSAPATPLERGTPSGGEPPSPASKEKSPEELKAMRTSGDQREYHDKIRRGEV